MEQSIYSLKTAQQNQALRVQMLCSTPLEQSGTSGTIGAAAVSNTVRKCLTGGADDDTLRAAYRNHCCYCCCNYHANYHERAARLSRSRQITDTKKGPPFRMAPASLG